MRHRERGVTFLGWMVLLAPMGLLLYAGIRLTPVYLEYMKIARTLDQVRDEFKSDQTDGRAVRLAIERRFDIEDVRVITKNDIKITKDGTGYKVQAVYEDSAPLFGNMSLVVQFDKVVQLE